MMKLALKLALQAGFVKNTSLAENFVVLGVLRGSKESVTRSEAKSPLRKSA
jgi:hypothetical protein